MSEETTILYRPVGEKELALIAESGYRAFPPRLFWQPIFILTMGVVYPCLVVMPIVCCMYPNFLLG